MLECQLHKLLTEVQQIPPLALDITGIIFTSSKSALQRDNALPLSLVLDLHGPKPSRLM